MKLQRHSSFLPSAPSTLPTTPHLLSHPCPSVLTLSHSFLAGISVFVSVYVSLSLSLCQCDEVLAPLVLPDDIRCACKPS